MAHFARIILLLGFFLFAVTAVAEGKPLLSEEIGTVMETEGAEAAKQRFAEIYPARQDEYEVDVQGLMDLGSRYMQSGDMDNGMVVMEMMSKVNMDMVSRAMNTYSPEMAEIQKKAEEADRMAQEQEKQNRLEEQHMRQQAEARARGGPRDDLDRFTGLFGDPADSAKTRTLFVTVSCDGYLVAGPMWADISPWWMRSAADKVFTYSDSFTSLSLEFETGEDGQAQKLLHDLDGLKSPLERIGPLPEGWENCLERPLR